MIGMWVNCVFGGKGVGMINLLLFLIVGVFLAGQIVATADDLKPRRRRTRRLERGPRIDVSGWWTDRHV
jgi:K+-transporting ATPase ATPase A chain